MIHQNVVIDGQDFGESQGRKYSKFYNEGKWNNFILPHLPKHCSEMSFMEFGCSGGLFLKLAKEYGFKKIIGIEADTESCAVAKKYCDADIRNASIDEEFNFDSIPSVDYLLMSNFHYHVHIPALLHLINILRRKVINVIIVSARVRTTRHKVNSDIDTTRRLFRHWEEVSYVEPISKDGDPRPRTNMYSVRFKSELVRMSIDYIISKMGRQGTRHYQEAMRMVKNGAKFDFTMPVEIHPAGRIIDGTHRLAYLKSQGDISIITEII